MGERDRGFAAEGQWLVWEIEAKMVWVQAEEYSCIESLSTRIDQRGIEKGEEALIAKQMAFS